MIYGTPAVLTEDDRTDRVGIRTLILSQLWQPSRGDLTIEQLDAEEPAPPDVPGGVLIIGRQRKRDKGALRTFWSFEGINGDGKTVTFKDRKNSIDFKFDGGFSERSLLETPNIQGLLNSFGGSVVDNQIYWPPLLSSAAASGPMLSSNASGKVNPLYNYQTQFVLDGTYTFRYMCSQAQYRSLPWSIAGKILSNALLPGVPPLYDDPSASGGNGATGRNWLALPLSPRRVGVAYEIIETYWLSREGGWPSEIYGVGNITSQPLGS